MHCTTVIMCLQAEYRQWAPERPQKMKREEYKPSEAPFEGKPSYQMDYQARRGAPVTRSMKPVEREYTKGGPLHADGFKVIESRCSNSKVVDEDCTPRVVQWRSTPSTTSNTYSRRRSHVTCRYLTTIKAKSWVTSSVKWMTPDTSGTRSTQVCSSPRQPASSSRTSPTSRVDEKPTKLE